jgi:hypothetical protein
VARVHGRRGRLYVGLASDSATASPVTFLNQWAIEFTVDKSDVTTFGDPNKTYVSGLPDASGTFAGFYDTDTAQLYTASQDGLARKFYLYPDTNDATDYWYGTALFDFSVSGSVSDAVAISGSWAAASAITQVKS